jgi:hypothetical protein
MSVRVLCQWAVIKAAGPSEEAMADAFQRNWSLKEVMTFRAPLHRLLVLADADCISKGGYERSISLTGVPPRHVFRPLPRMPAAGVLG